MSKQVQLPSPAVTSAFRAAGLRCTPQRFAVLDFLFRGKVHATADEIAAAINRPGSGASRATVYNALHALMDAGLVREVGGGAAARYDASLERHHHFTCEVCGSLEDIDWFELPRAARVLGSRRVHNYEIVFRGVCAGCQRKEVRS
jgi:Fe2+ or Zn2+ uptake regulation protein